MTFAELIHVGTTPLRSHAESPGWWTDADYLFQPNHAFRDFSQLPDNPNLAKKGQYTLSQMFNLALAAQSSPWTVSGTFQANGTLTQRYFGAISGDSLASLPVWYGGQFVGNVPYDVHSGVAGAALSLSWEKTDTTAYRWFQLVHTNTPASADIASKSSTVGGGYWYIDNFAAGWNQPWYKMTDQNGAYIQSAFTDMPDRSFHAGDDWRAYLVLGRDAGANQIEIADNMGVWWGFYDPPTSTLPASVPAPPGVILAAAGATVLLYRRRVRRG